MPNIVKRRGNTESFESGEIIKSIQNAVLKGYKTHQEKEKLIEEVSESIIKNILIKDVLDSEMEDILMKDAVDNQVMDTVTIHYCIEIKI